MNTYYVWHDHLLEELFSMEKNELDISYPELKLQLQKEKIEFYEIEAESMEHSYSEYRKLIQQFNITASSLIKSTFH